MYIYTYVYIYFLSKNLIEGRMAEAETGSLLSNSVTRTLWSALEVKGSTSGPGTC